MGGFGTGCSLVSRDDGGRRDGSRMFFCSSRFSLTRRNILARGRCVPIATHSPLHTQLTPMKQINQSGLDANNALRRVEHLMHASAFMLLSILVNNTFRMVRGRCLFPSTNLYPVYTVRHGNFLPQSRSFSPLCFSLLRRRPLNRRHKLSFSPYLDLNSPVQ